MRLLLALSAALTLNVASAQELLGQEHWESGALKSTRYSEGDREHFITYYENGQVKEIGCFRNGRREGVWKQYSDTGALLAQAGFQNGQRQGIWEFRNTADQPMGRLTYAGGLLATGDQYDPVGALTAHRDY